MQVKALVAAAGANFNKQNLGSSPEGELQGAWLGLTGSRALGLTDCSDAYD